MTMTDKDICLENRQAKDKDAQIGILADLNQCSEGQIADILRRGGEQIDTPSNDRDALRERAERTPNQPGITLTKAEAGVLVEYLEESIYGYAMNSLASSEPRECLYKLYELFGVYKRLKEVGE